MSKQIVLRVALIGVCALTIGLTGCNNQPPPPAAPPHPAGQAGAVPQSMINEMKGMPPDQQQRILQSMKGTPQEQQVQQALQPNGGSKSGGQ